MESRFPNAPLYRIFSGVATIAATQGIFLRSMPSRSVLSMALVDADIPNRRCACEPRRSNPPSGAPSCRRVICVMSLLEYHRRPGIFSVVGNFSHQKFQGTRMEFEPATALKHLEWMQSSPG